MTRIHQTLAVVLLIAALGDTAMAETASTTLTVSATVSEECALGGATMLSFGTLSMLGSGAASDEPSPSIGGGSFEAICTNGTRSPKLRFTSAHGDGNGFNLLGADGQTKIPYALAESTGAAIAHDVAAAFTGFTADGTTKTLVVKGTIAAGAKAGKKAQTYSDTITITSSYGL